MWVLWITPCAVTLMNARRVTPAARSAWPRVDVFAATKRARQVSAQTENNPVKMRRLRIADRAVRFLFIDIIYGRGGGVGRGLAAGVSLGVGVAVGVDVGVGVAVGKGSWTSNEPTSSRPFLTRS